MWWIWVLAPAEAGCRGSIGTLERAWADLAVRVPAGPRVGDIDEAATTLAAHSAVAKQLRGSRPRRGREELDVGLIAAEAWLEQNQASMGIERVQREIDTVRRICGVPAPPTGG